MRSLWTIALSTMLAVGAVAGIFRGQALAQEQAQAQDRGAISLAPHRAVYDLSMVGTVGGKGPAGASGRIVYEIRGNACSGYAVSFRQLTEVQPQEGEPSAIEVRSASFEQADGSVFRFRSDTSSGGRTVKTIEGVAERAGGKINVTVQGEPPKSFAFDGEALFPVQQSLAVIAAARAGQTIFESKSFDASGDADGIYHSLHVIGRPLSEPAGDLTDAQTHMKDMRRWRTVASSFDLADTNAPPIYTLTYDLWESGVSSNVRIDYGEFTLAGRMRELEFFAPEPCDK